jgi:hypothetical protein
MHPANSGFHRRLALSFIALFLSVSFCPALVLSADDPLDAAVEAARKTRDEKQLQSVKTQLEQRVAENPNDAVSYYNLARVQSYLFDVYETRKDKKTAQVEVDKAIESAQRSTALNDKSADPHSLLADLYGKKFHSATACSQIRSSVPKSKMKTPKRWLWMIRILASGPALGANTLWLLTGSAGTLPKPSRAFRNLWQSIPPRTKPGSG